MGYRLIRILEEQKGNKGDDVHEEILEFAFICSLGLLLFCLFYCCFKEVLCQEEETEMEDDQNEKFKTRTRFDTLRTNIAKKEEVVRVFF
jgi:hypothetical protein